MTPAPDTMIDSVPKPINGIEVEVVEGEVLLYHPQTTRAIYLNSSAAVIWGLCDGTRSVREMIRVISDSYPETNDLVDHVIHTLNQLQENGALVIS